MDLQRIFVGLSITKLKKQVAVAQAAMTRRSWAVFKCSLISLQAQLSTQSRGPMWSFKQFSWTLIILACQLWLWNFKMTIFISCIANQIKHFPIFIQWSNYMWSWKCHSKVTVLSEFKQMPTKCLGGGQWVFLLMVLWPTLVMFGVAITTILSWY